jgi:DNA-binding Lrp family transcriptional regulator
MALESSSRPSAEAGSQNRIRPTWAVPPPNGPGSGELDDIDRHLVRELARDARIANNALADRVGIAPSTCLGRVRSLRERGVIRGYHADVDQAALGRPLQAMIAVRLQAHARGHIRDFVAEVAGQPEVLNVFFLAGKDDFLLHVAATSPTPRPR